MPLRVVLDSTILVSAFLTPSGAADAVLHKGMDEEFTCCLADEIIEERMRRLFTPRLQERYAYTADDVETFKATLQGSFLIVSNLPL
jgi:putative PIN family toxin of toxin-antitoxin system